jgi:hypothetical protein
LHSKQSKQLPVVNYAIEDVGALVALTLALIIWLVMRHRKDLAYYAWISSALVANIPSIIGVISIIFPGELPAMVRNGLFTPTAEAINIFGGLYRSVTETIRIGGDFYDIRQGWYRLKIYRKKTLIKVT